MGTWPRGVGKSTLLWIYTRYTYSLECSYTYSLENQNIMPYKVKHFWSQRPIQKTKKYHKNFTEDLVESTKWVHRDQIHKQNLIEAWMYSSTTVQQTSFYPHYTLQPKNSTSMGTVIVQRETNNPILFYNLKYLQVGTLQPVLLLLIASVILLEIKWIRPGF